MGQYEALAAVFGWLKNGQKTVCGYGHMAMLDGLACPLGKFLAKLEGFGCPMGPTLPQCVPP